MMNSTPEGRNDTTGSTGSTGSTDHGVANGGGGGSVLPYLNEPQLMSMPDYVANNAILGCPNCHGLGWVCENHSDKPWESGIRRNKKSIDCQCGGAGAPCPCTGMSDTDVREEQDA